MLVCQLTIPVLPCLRRDSLTLRHGQTYTFIVQMAAVLGPVHRVQLSWERKRASLLAMPCLLWCPDTSLAVSQVTLLDMDQPDRSVGLGVVEAGGVAGRGGCRGDCWNCKKREMVDGWMS